MNFKREKIKELYLGDTQIENIFITEYMVDAEGEFIKVYLTAIMYADRDDISNSLIAKHLGIEEEDVLRAWNYWEKCGVIKKHYPDPSDRFRYSVEFVNLKARLYGIGGEEERQAGSIPEELRDRMDDETMRNLYSSIESITNRMLEGREPEAVISWVYEDGLDPGLICRAYKYSVEKRGNNRFKYIAGIIREWEKENIRTTEDAERFLEENDLRYNQYRRVMKALGFHRNPTEDEQSKMDTWFDEMNFSIDRVLEACYKTSGISNPNFNYVNRILTSWHTGERGGSNQAANNGRGAGDPRKSAVAKVKKLYEEQRRKNEELQATRRKAIYKSVPRIEAIDDELRKTSMRISRLVLTGGAESGVSADALREKLTELNGEKAYLLTEQNFPPDYLDLQYECKDCRDTGVLENGERCKCFSEKLKLFV